jgi:two-component system chemotaxis response regulator CheY
MAHNILIVDDSKIVRAVVRKTIGLAISTLGDVFEAGNGREALAVMQSNWVDIVFADINMPEMNGIELVETMKREGLMDKIPVVIISTERSVTRIEELKAKGVSAYLNKPFTPEAIREVVNRLLGPGSEEAAPTEPSCSPAAGGEK